VVVELTESVDVPVRPQRLWRAVTDWERQGEWMLGTTVRVTAGDGRSVGSELAARTYGVTDTMVISVWDPPGRCEVRHTGRLVRGVGSFEVLPRGAETATFRWGERLDLPLGALGRLGWVLLRPVFRFGVRRSLNRLARSLA
jgi:carbon monoxide dehydrogenase subunit G